MVPHDRPPLDGGFPRIRPALLLKWYDAVSRLAYFAGFMEVIADRFGNVYLVHIIKTGSHVLVFYAAI